MPIRKPHHKSRKGCLTCKRRRVKCDERGPPCTNCRVRGTQCEYGDLAAPSALDALPQDAISYSPPLLRSSPTASSSAAGAEIHRNSLELRLLHRWSTVTYKSVASDLAQDHDRWQMEVPEVALHYQFLLDAIFAVTAFEMAFSFPQDATQYLKLALEYQGLAFRTFQDHLKASIDSKSQNLAGSDVEESRGREVVVNSLVKFLNWDDSQIQQKQLQTLSIELNDAHHNAMLHASLLLTVLALASATATFPSSSPSAEVIERGSAIQQMLAYHHLLQGTVTIMMSKSNCVSTQEMLSKLPQFLDLPKMPLEPDTEAAKSRIETMNEARAISRIDEASNSAQEGCRSALVWLRHLFQTCSRGDLLGHCLLWSSMAGNDYVQAIKDGDRIALLILLAWGGLLNPLGEFRWYTKDFGKSLVREISEIFHDNDDHTTRVIMSWATNRACKKVVVQSINTIQ